MTAGWHILVQSRNCVIANFARHETAITDVGGSPGWAVSATLKPEGTGLPFMI